MSWAALPPGVRAAAEASCTPRQLQALRYAAAGASTRHVAKLMGISRASAREHLSRAHAKIADHIEKETHASTAE